MAEIDTAAPFASVRDAVNMFGERSTQRAFPTTNTLQLEKIHSLEAKLHQLHEEHAGTQKQLLIAESTTIDAFKELTKTKHLLEESKKKAESIIAAKISLLESQLDAAFEQESHRTYKIECERQEISNLCVELEDFKVQHRTTLIALKGTQEENDKLRAEIVHEKNTLAEQCEQANIVAERMEGLIEDLLATKDLLAKADSARERIEKELQIFKDIESERVKNAAHIATKEIEKLRNELQDAEDKQEEIILAIEKLKDELIATKEAEKTAVQAEVDANLNLKRMKIEVEDAKIAKEKARVMAIQVEEMNAKLKRAAQEENSLLASLASLKAELKNTNNELDNMKKEAEETSIEMEEQINQLQVDLDAAIAGEAKTKECLSDLNEALQQMSAEAVEAKAVAAQAIEEATLKTQELEEALSHIKTLECQLQAAMKETESTRASETFAHTEVKFLKKKINSSLDAKRDGQEVTISYDEYETMAKKVVDSEDLAAKRIAAAVAHVDAAKASELETSKKLESIKHLLETSQVALKQAVQVAEVAEAAKSAVEGELRKWRSENEQRRKAAVTAVMAVGSNGIIKTGSHAVNGNIPYYHHKDASINKPSGRLFNNSLHALQPKESLAQMLQYNFPSDEKTKTKKNSSKIGSYFSKKIK